MLLLFGEGGIIFCCEVGCVLSDFVIFSLGKKERAGCFTFLVYLMSLDSYRCLPLPRGAVGLSAVCDCGISWSYSLNF